MQGPEPRHSLELLDWEQSLLGSRLSGLTPAELDSPSNLTGWHILDLGVHITRVCDSILLAVQRATIGDRTPAFGPAAKPREDAIRAMTPAGWAELQQRVCRQIGDVVGGLSDDDLRRLTFPHSQGDRSISWFCTQLLAEVAFHRWDLERSLGFEGPLDEELATYLLPFLLDPDQHLFGRRHTAGASDTFSVSADGLSWTLAVTSEGTSVRADPDSHEGRIEAPAGWLALAIYGRVRTDGAAFTIDGPPDTGDRFATIFGPN